MGIDTIVLDLDGTVISTTESKVSIKGGSKFDDNMIIYKRHHVDDFIKFILKNFKYICIWSDSLQDYIDKVVSILFKNNMKRITKTFNRDDCDACFKIFGRKKDLNYLKLRSVTKYPISHMIIIDNIPENTNPAQNRIVIKTMDFDEMTESKKKKLPTDAVKKSQYKEDKELIKVTAKLNAKLKNNKK